MFNSASYGTEISNETRHLKALKSSYLKCNTERGTDELSANVLPYAFASSRCTDVTSSFPEIKPTLGCPAPLFNSETDRHKPADKLSLRAATWTQTRPSCVSSGKGAPTPRMPSCSLASVSARRLHKARAKRFRSPKPRSKALSLNSWRP